VLALRYDWRNNSVLFVHNLSPIPTEVKFRVGAKLDGQLVNLLSNDHAIPDESGEHRILLEPYGYRWFRIGGLNYLLKRTENLGISSSVPLMKGNRMVLCGRHAYPSWLRQEDP
jgi:maltose alpha-D-glucosyltransferase / alpha-amylase